MDRCRSFKDLLESADNREWRNTGVYWCYRDIWLEVFCCERIVDQISNDRKDGIPPITVIRSLDID